ncbi:unnamed protein product [Plutella xylostella]|uniref:(diamondback moth) hypothetical protein n=1 Tax=Plutella xylostella TaxID=51655 RepID=A0A8S4G7K4_PLUXY|nr:unnamed protein product [Plutella xylostella]
MSEIEVNCSTAMKTAGDTNMDEVLDEGDSSSYNTLQGTHMIWESAISKLEENLTMTFSEQEYHSCSIYNRLSRKCNCMNRTEYNDLMIHFNEGSKYELRSDGEVVKNIRILKRFLYMGGSYCKNALIFLEEGLQSSSQDELKEIIDGFVRADVCNVFEGTSLAMQCISLPCKYAVYGDNNTQALAAMVLFKIAEMEGGRQYLNANTKITSDLRKIIRKLDTVLEANTLLILNATYNFLCPLSNANPTIVSFTCKIQEDADTKFSNKETETKTDIPNESLNSDIPLKKREKIIPRYTE